MKRTRLKRKSQTATALLKDDIQAWVRLICAKRDGGCVLRHLRHCGGDCEVVDDEIISETVIQADHLLTRSNSATYADTRLIVCLCKPCHAWKHWNEKEYNNLVKKVLSKKRIRLWEKCLQDLYAHKTKKMDWTMELLALKREYARLT